MEAVAGWQRPIGYGADFAAESENWEVLAKTNLDEALAKVDAEGVEVKRTVSQGHPAEVLTNASTNADLIVVGSRGHGGFAGMLLGSSAGMSARTHTAPWWLFATSTLSRAQAVIRGSHPLMPW